MSNVVQFKKPPAPKKPNPGLRKLLTLLGVVAALVATWAYFQYVGGEPG